MACLATHSWAEHANQPSPLLMLGTKISADIAASFPGETRAAQNLNHPTASPYNRRIVGRRVLTHWQLVQDLRAVKACSRVILFPELEK